MAVARALHDAGPRASDAFSVVDCATRQTSPPGELVSPSAHGTRVLMNLDALPQSAQLQLARILSDAPPGVIGAVSSPEEALRHLRLRRDLRNRFATRVIVPALRHRRGDIPTLVGCLVGESASAAGVPVPSFSREALTLLAALPWRRNLDELHEVLDVMVRSAVGGTVRLEDVLEHIPIEPLAPLQATTRSLRDARISFERHYIASVLNRQRGRMADAAKVLGIQRTNLYRKVRQLGIGATRARQR